MAAQDFEGLGVFYLGRKWSPSNARALDEPLLYESKDLNTHALIAGMTGSGKTGLALALLEEAALDGIPAIAIDPKGDLGNLLLAFPAQQPADFEPWVDAAEAERAGLSPNEHAARCAQAWRAGLAEWGQDAARIARLRQAADFAIYTPGSSAGLQLSLLRSLDPPPAALADERESAREKLQSAVGALLALLGIEADPLQSREHILLARIVAQAWDERRSIELAELVRAIHKPPFERVGVLELESFFPAAERAALALRVNNLLAAPGFEAWLEGEPLDVQRLLWTADGRPRVSIVSIAHLSDAERMSVVTLLLGAVLAWMRAQSGTSSLRAILYMDEVFGYFPPVANPPSKLPMLTLLKQARAFGLGVVLATQNPVDLDYKGLANCGTWFLGRLQTERDKARVLDGLEGASATGGRGFDRARIDALLAGLGKRVFLLHSVHEPEPVLFQTRWTLAYLCGPLTRAQIARLCAERKLAARATGTAAAGAQATAAGSANVAGSPVRATGAAPGSAIGSAIGSARRPLAPQGIEEVFLRDPSGTAGALLVPHLLGTVRVHYVDAKLGIDLWQKLAWLAPLDSASGNPWEAARELDERAQLDAAPRADARFGELPAAAARASNYASWSKMLASQLYSARALELLRSAELGLVARPGEPEGEFRARLAQAERERRDLALEKLRQKYAPKLAQLQERLRKAEARIEKEAAQYDQRKLETGLSIGASLLGALFGRKTLSQANVGRVASAGRALGRASREKDEIAAAREEREAVASQLRALDDELRAASAALQAPAGSGPAPLERVRVPARKADIAVEGLALAWAAARAP